MFSFSSLISQAKKFARLLKSSCALSVTRTAHYRDSMKAVSMPRSVCARTFSLSSTFSTKQIVKSPPVNCFLPKFNIPKGLTANHWQRNKTSLCGNYKANIFLFELLSLFLYLTITIMDTNFHLEWYLYYF